MWLFSRKKVVKIVLDDSLIQIGFSCKAEKKTPQTDVKHAESELSFIHCVRSKHE